MDQNTDDSDLECLTLWRCIGCGAMGNTAECTGGCDFHRGFVVDAEVHAELLENVLLLRERTAALRQFIGDVIAATEIDPFEPALADLRLRARQLLAETSNAVRPEAAPEDERAEVWLCATCGMAEAQRNCLGICIRRTGDFVLTTQHDQLAADALALDGTVAAMAVMLRQIAWSAPKPGQSETMRAALRTSGRQLAQLFLG